MSTYVERVCEVNLYNLFYPGGRGGIKQCYELLYPFQKLLGQYREYYPVAAGEGVFSIMPDYNWMLQPNGVPCELVHHHFRHRHHHHYFLYLYLTYFYTVIQTSGITSIWKNQ